MKFFIDSADVQEIEKLVKTGMVDGVTTNPSLIAKSGKKFIDVAQAIAQIVEGPISLEVVAVDADSMLREADKLAAIAPNICIKLPLTPDGLSVCKRLSNQGVAVNVTLCFSAVQALLAAKAGARFISPFVGRLDDIGQSGMALIEEIATLYRNYPDFLTEILVASVRHPEHVLQAALIGADVVTLPPDILWKLYNHPLTDKGLAAFLKDWEAAGLTLPE